MNTVGGRSSPQPVNQQHDESIQPATRRVFPSIRTLNPPAVRALQKTEETQHSTSIHLRIDELVLHNFAPGDRHAIAAALEHELTRLLHRDGMPAGLSELGATARLDGGGVQLPRDIPPTVIGEQLARSLYQTLARSSNMRQMSGGSNR